MALPVALAPAKPVFLFFTHSHNQPVSSLSIGIQNPKKTPKSVRDLYQKIFAGMNPDDKKNDNEKDDDEKDDDGNSKREEKEGRITTKMSLRRREKVGD